MPRVALATFRELPAIAPDDAPVADALRRSGVAVSAAIWDDPGIDWRSFDTVVIRSTWDYHLRPAEYAAWVRQFTAGGTRLWNPPGAVLWNVHKGYLADLARWGITVAPTEHVTGGTASDLRSVLARRGWDEAVVKPAVSVGAVGTWRAFLAAPDEARFAEQVRAADLLIQPYLPEVESAGEWSLVFLDGAYSHAVRKRPAPGDFRVQEHLGGTAERAEPSAGLITQAAAAVAAVDGPLLYARVDGVERGGCLLLTELEITEPYLYLGMADGAADRFAEAILRALSSA
jgi:glutathione synthase/RimK-type ligase-like ATP-grasp enzyme